MATNFPGSLDNNTTLPNPGSGSFTNNPSHAGQHDNENDAIKAIEAKVGTGASTAAASQVFRGTGAGTSAWGQLVLTTDVTGILPVANGGTGISSLATGIATFLGTPSSANLAAAITDETGSGALVFATSPTLSSPTLTTPTIASFTNAQHNHSNAAGGGQLVTAALPNGTQVQMVSTNFTVAATGTTTIPTDDTIPQNTEGDQYMTQAITPLFSTSTLKIEITALASNSAGISDLTMALFQDTAANAIAAITQTQAGSTYEQNMKIVHTMAAGTTSATTFKVRIGDNAAGTTTFGGQSGARKFGGVTIANITITETRG